MRTFFSDLDLVRLDGSPLPADVLTGKPTLFVNVASECGFTKQYNGLQALYAEHRDRGLMVVGVPCNQFGGQEPGTPEEIQAFCSARYNVDFLLLRKQEVNGPGRSALYRFLIGSPAGGGRDVAWNFEKFLVGSGGEVRARFDANVKPEAEALRTAVEQALTTIAEPAM